MRVFATSHSHRQRGELDMKQGWKYLFVIGLTMLTAACSSSKTDEDSDWASGDDEELSADFSDTDEVSDSEDYADTDDEEDDGEEDQSDFTNENELAESLFQNESTSSVESTSNSNYVDTSFSGTGEYINYTVQSGDTLMKIAFEQYGDLYLWKKIKSDNEEKIGSISQLVVGTTLKIEKSSTVPSISHEGEQYLIKQGDTLGLISTDVYGTSKKWKKLWENNRQLIKDPNRIYAGFYLYYIFNEQDRVEKENSAGQGPAPLAGGSKGTTVTTPGLIDPGFDDSRDPSSFE